MNVKKVLCVCAGNTCRSPALEAMLRREAEKREIKITFESAGTSDRHTGKPANAHSVECMRNIGLDITKHRARCISDLDLSKYSLIIVAEPCLAYAISSKVSAPIIVANTRAGAIADPSMQGEVAYAEMVEAIEQAIPEILQKIEFHTHQLNPRHP